jgi:hypothetical protein
MGFEQYGVWVKSGRLAVEQRSMTVSGPTGRSMNARSVHSRVTLGRPIVVMGQADLHLVWSESRLLLKQLPEFVDGPHSVFQNDICQKTDAFTNVRVAFPLPYA